MDIFVFVKRVAATQEEELRIIDDGKNIDLSKIPFKMNDWDNYAVEEAVKIVEGRGGSVTAVSIGNTESDEVLRRAIAMGSKDGILIETKDTLHDPAIRALAIYNFIKKENVHFDAIFTGVQSEDDQFAATGGFLAGKMGLPYASMVIGIDAIENGYFIVRRELEGGLQERIKIKTPCVISIQSGINEPRYVSIMGIRKASKVERKTLKFNDYAQSGDAVIDLVRWSYPEKKGGAKMLTGEVDAVCKELLEILKNKGVC
ncbi:MAG TPA: electron transfer flavoprotein subunit beta/FixA family protein [Syntrophorhabdaceae bacterium]|nr:electron transfer flavoprotein subunit beta/FixA family protein [Syntrophorhabdaceae bacterium]HPP07174.1 electron transfer flavoprotein subunit beta/FixA family protein [Syntrophorhabdaceae bacterium]